MFKPPGVERVSTEPPETDPFVVLDQDRTMESQWWGTTRGLDSLGFTAGGA